MPYLEKNPVHLGLGATAVEQPPFTGMEWYAAYTKRVESDGHEGRLVSLHSFSSSWDMWEMHPDGSELVVCTKGVVTLRQESSEGETQVTLREGEYAINAPGVWHTADLDDGQSATLLFVTSGIGTQHRPR